MAKTNYSPAAEVEIIANELIPLHHKHICQHDVRVVYVYRDDVPSRGGKEVWGEAKRKSGLDAYLAGEERPDGSLDDAFFVIVISLPIWKQLDYAKREALVDHELSHCWVELDDEGDIQLKIHPHDVEEFISIIRRHGPWQLAAAAMVKAAKNHQLGLPFDADEAQTAGGQG